MAVDPRWRALVDMTLSALEPHPERKAIIEARLREDGTLALLHRAWRHGRGARQVARVLRRLAESEMQ